VLGVGFLVLGIGVGYSVKPQHPTPNTQYQTPLHNINSSSGETDGSSPKNSILPVARNAILAFEGVNP
jgi:hypothetical protein